MDKEGVFDLSKVDLIKSIEQLKKEGKEDNFIKAYASEVDRRRCRNISLILSEIKPDVQTKFEDKQLLNFVMEELTKTHIGDDNLKMTTLLACISGLLKNPKLRTSIAIKGNSSEGKDNLIKTCLRHMPNESWKFLTSGTQATIEDDIRDFRIIAFSEVNKNREAGANKYLTEAIKQMSEGGTSAMKKDKRADNKTMRHEINEQKSVLFGTTETEKDEELETRFIEGTIKTNYERIKKVNDKTCETFSDLDLLLENASESESWLRNGLTAFFRKEKQPIILLPYTKFLNEKIEGQDVFDNTSPRSQRDIKRLISLTCAMTYLFQEQRKKTEHKGEIILISEVDDFINTLNYSAEFFNQSYSGIEGRLTEVLRVMKELGDSMFGVEESKKWIARDDVQDKLGISRLTIKNYCETLANEGHIEGIRGKELNLSEGTNQYDGNKIYFKRHKKGDKKAIIRHNISKLKEFLEAKMKELPQNSIAFSSGILQREIKEGVESNEEKKAIVKKV